MDKLDDSRTLQKSFDGRFFAKRQVFRNVLPNDYQDRMLLHIRERILETLSTWK
jgi:hypothetical protein